MARFTAARRPHRVIAILSNAARTLIAVHAELRAHRDLAVDSDVVVADPASLYEPDEMPDVDDIQAAAVEYDRASDLARRADRGKRAARKTLDRLPAGTYGAWRVFRTPSSRQTPDLAEITRLFKAHGLGPVPMKPCAASLKVERLAVAAEPIVAVAA